MTRTGDRPAALLVAALLLSAPALAEVELYQTVDRNEVGTEDTFRLTIVVSGAPDDAQVQFPGSEDFEVLSRSQSTQMSYQLGGGGPGVIQRVQKYVLVMRANRPGSLTIPPASLVSRAQTWRTDSIKMEVKKGRLHGGAPRAQRGLPQLPDPFRNFPFPGFGSDPFEDLGEEPAFPTPDIPRSDSDLFLEAHLDKDQIYVGEQTTLSIYIFSRVDLSSVDTVTMPKLDGFWSEDIESPSQLTAEQRVIGGVPYRAYLIRRRALFPVRAGKLEIQPAEADITTGFLFAGHRVHRKSNPLEVKVRPLPPGAPVGFSDANVGSWRLSADFSQTEVSLGEPITVRVLLEGRGNVKNVTPPPLQGPPSFKLYDPTTTDKVGTSKGRLGGRRVQEYLVMPQQTGTFTVPGLSFAYFDPETGQYAESRTDPVTVLVRPSATGANALAAAPSGNGGDDAAKNKLEPTGLKALRHHASFEPAAPPLWRRWFFLPLAAAPVGLWLAMAMVGLVRGALGREDEAGLERKRARAARERLAAAEKLRAGPADQFYVEVEKALLHFLEAKLGGPVLGLTRPQLVERMTAVGAKEERQRRVLSVLEACDVGRFAPGGGDAVRSRVLDDAAAAMEGWDSR